MADRDLLESWASIEECFQGLLDHLNQQIELTNNRANDFTQLVKAQVAAERAVALCHDVICNLSGGQCND